MMKALANSSSSSRFADSTCQRYRDVRDFSANARAGEGGTDR